MKLFLLLFAFFFIFQTTCILAITDPIKCKTNDQDPSKVFYTITVSKSSRGNFTTLKQAIESIPRKNDKWVKIFLMPGTYKEQVIINETQCIFLEGNGRKTTTITFDAHSSAEQSITFDAYGHNFVAKGITFRNSYNLPGGSKSTAPAVAFRAIADKQAFFYCGFEGYQDTLWDSTGRHYYKSCFIEGAIDFIWGAGASYYEKCAINVIGDGFITAQGKNTSDQISGFVFSSCRISGTGKVLLGRAYNAFATVIYMNSIFTDIIKPEGWDIWNQSGHEKDVLFVEHKCKGPGADTSKRVLLRKNFSNVSKYYRQAFINKDGWIENLPKIN